ncbi:hypothetical protein ACIRBX_24260 [Kitasatospora sp. NPDC096147]|uniref:hypothetical protein n=1 Tax=Kitasatospora sp. NPDC096147 TaxID=3364093 RepID=UPI0037F84428
MDRFVGRGRLEWWANPLLCVERYDLDLTVTVDAAGTWRASATHRPALDPARREGWDFLLELDPHFTVAFPGEEVGAIVVRVAQAADGTLTLTDAPEWDGTGSVTFDIDCGP